MKLIKQFYVENKYSGSNWNEEKTEKYIFKDNKGMIYEVGYFEHFLDGKFVKSVIELPVSYGCPAKCSYCASSNINYFHSIHAKELKKIFNYVYELKKLKSQRNVLLSMTGIGDFFFNQNNVYEFLSLITKYKNIQITLSSTFWDKELLSKFVKLKDSLSIHYIQFTYITDNINILNNLIPIYKTLNLSSRLDQFIDFVSESNDSFFRINYIVINKINDSLEDVDFLIEKLKKIKNKIIVRISKLNETHSSKKNLLETVPISQLKKINQRILNSGIQCYTFYSNKNDNMNCGQLITEINYIE